VSSSVDSAAVFDTVVVGAGVIGLAIARAEALCGREVVILEREGRFGTATSSRNSEVIHAGIYNPTDTWKTRLCVAGRPALYRYCAERGIDHRCTGKLLVATDADEHATLERLVALSRANGITGDDALVPLSAAEARRLEPELFCIAAALSPSTGVVDPEQLMRALLGDAEERGAHVAYHAAVEGARADAHGFTVHVGGERSEAVRCRRLINAAGLGANELARRIDGYDAGRVPQLYLVKGSYFAFAGASPFRRPIYPTRHGGLSVHATLDLAGRLKFGPDADLVPDVDYAVDPSRGAAFEKAARRFWPDLPEGALQPGYAGIRPKLSAPGEPWRDFAIDGPAQHGVPGLVHLFGMESPGLTACLAIGELVAKM
jgi:L-2-hydroxyglutarate oxidase LhgO